MCVYPYLVDIGMHFYGRFYEWAGNDPWYHFACNVNSPFRIPVFKKDLFYRHLGKGTTNWPLIGFLFGDAGFRMSKKHAPGV
jgi:hypothetical protein